MNHSGRAITSKYFDIWGGALLSFAAMHHGAHIVEFHPAQESPTLGATLKAVADDLRLQILRVMARDSFNVTELCEILGTRQNALSHHLKILTEASFLCKKREGTSTFYRRAIPASATTSIQEHLLTAIDAEPLSPTVRTGIAKVQMQREQNSNLFFKDNAERFRKQQELIAPWADYSEISLQLLDRLTEVPFRTLLEVGVGEGWLLPELHKRAKNVIALDLSEEMLALARRHAGHLAGIEFVQGSTDALLANGATADAVIANMVMHHAPDPRRILVETANLLTPSGTLIVSELCAHDQAWAREHCGDLWLGFMPDKLVEWAAEAGLKLEASVFLAQRNGFQIQVQHFQRC